LQLMGISYKKQKCQPVKAGILKIYRESFSSLIFYIKAQKN
jgi:hypothetical protein